MQQNGKFYNFFIAQITIITRYRIKVYQEQSETYYTVRENSR